MTPTETAALLRRFNAWRRGDEAIKQPDPREIGLAIDAAIEMIESVEEYSALCDKLAGILTRTAVQKRLAAQWGYVPANEMVAPDLLEALKTLTSMAEISPSELHQKHPDVVAARAAIAKATEAKP